MTMSIHIQAFDDEGNRKLVCSTTSADYRRDIAIMENAVAFFYAGAVRRESHITPELLWRVVMKGEPIPNGGTDLTIRELQTRLPWSVRYSTDFRSSPVSHKDFAHALTHVLKAAGTLAAVVDRMDHDRTVADEGEVNRAYCGKYIADLVICALRMANTIPGGVLDLQRAVQERLETKNGVKLENSNV